MAPDAERGGSVEDMPASLLISAAYDAPKRRALLKFYNPETGGIELRHDWLGHKPYCYSRLAPDELGDLATRDDVLDIRQETRRDVLSDSDARVSKIVVADPLAIGGTQSAKSIRNTHETWESDIKYYENYVYDNDLVIGMYYEIRDSKFVRVRRKIPDAVAASLRRMLLDHDTSDGIVDADEYRKYVREWADTLNEPIPRIRRLSFDIEVEAEQGRLPDAHLADRRVTAVGFEGTDGLHRVLVLGADDGMGGDPESGAEISFYDDERAMLLDAFAIIDSYAVVLTYNGDTFDMPYLYARASRLGIESADNPFYMMKDSATLKRGVHLDLYRTFSNHALQIYAFANKYPSYPSLNSVAEGLLGEKKTDFGVPIFDLTPRQLAIYCYNDARLTYKLTSFADDTVMHLLIVAARISKMPIDDIARTGVSQWIRSLLYYEHRARRALIPRPDELAKRSTDASVDAVIRDKKYRGGLVVDPQKGVHFKVTVMDFASLYPSIIKVKNLSYETVRCAHDSCRANMIPGTSHWVCTKHNGIASLLIGSLRDLRVNYYKALSRDASLGPVQRQQYTIVSQALKVILNASYGVMGAEIFPLYFLPAAESTTAMGRHIIMQTMERCRERGIEVLYGDSVTGETPVLHRDGGVLSVRPISSLFDAARGAYSRGRGEVLSARGFAAIRRVYRHRVKKRGYRIWTAASYVECTEDHSLIVGGREASPRELRVGDRLTLARPRLPASLRMPARLAWALGYFLAAGRCEARTRRVTVAGSARRLGAFAGALQAHLGLECNRSRRGLAVAGRGAYEYFEGRFYCAGQKVVPPAVLSASRAAKAAFVEGALAGSAGRGASDAWKSQSAAAALAMLASEARIGWRLDVRAGALPRVRRSARPSRGDEITRITPFEIDAYVYDVETSDARFCGGIGSVLLHNTDSMFVKNPTSEQVSGIIEDAKRDHNVELEVDKEYRYVVLSDRKKNYFGVTASGAVDVKGLMGKKSHTPQFLRRLFSAITGHLAAVNTHEDFERVKNTIEADIRECVDNLRAGRISLTDLAFHVMLNRSPDEYTKNIPQHIKAARQLERGSSSGTLDGAAGGSERAGARKVRKGDIISFVKTITDPKVKPVELASVSEIDTKKYLETIQSTLEQVTSVMDIDFDLILGSQKQVTMDSF